MICRVAESCFWLARYVERVDTLARLLAVNHAFELDVQAAQADVWKPIVVVAGEEEGFVESLGASAFGDAEVVQNYLTWGRDHPSSIHASLRWARENARTVREVISVEVWETINDTWLWLESREARRSYQRERDVFYDRLSKQCMLIHGVCYSTMLHEEPYVFMKLGRAVERVGWTARTLDVQHHSLEEGASGITDAARWLAVLRSQSAVDAFFQRGARPLTGAGVVEFLIFDRAFPRAVLHNLDRARSLLVRLVSAEPRGASRRSWNRLERLRGSVLQLDGDLVQSIGLHKILTGVIDETALLCSAIHDDYLDPSPETLLRGASALRRVAPERVLRSA